MKITVVGGRGRAGSRIVGMLIAAGHDARSASPSSGVDTLSGAGVAHALADTVVVVDATAPRDNALDFFTRSTQTLLEHGRRAGVRHHVVLSVVGADRMMDAPYMRAKVAQEDLVRRSGIPYSIVRATQFHDFIQTLADVFTDGSVVRVPHAHIQPVSVDDVATVVAKVAIGSPINGTIEAAGPERMTFAAAIARAAPGRHVVVDATAKYFGTALHEDTLLPASGAQLGQIRL